MFPAVTNFFRNERMMSKQVFYKSILQVAKKKDKKLYNQLKLTYDYPILPVQIAKIEKRVDDVDMVDISTQRGNFIANCLIVHNSSQRFERLIEGMAIEFYKRIAEACNKDFLSELKNLKGILIGGPGPTKEDFIEYLNNEIKKKIITVADLTYTDESGLHDLVDRSREALAKEAVAEEKAIMEKFLSLLGKETGKARYGYERVKEALELGAVETLLLSEVLDPDKLDELEGMAMASGTEVRIISTETREGQQLRDIGCVGAILRYSTS